MSQRFELNNSSVLILENLNELKNIKILENILYNSKDIQKCENGNFFDFLKFYYVNNTISCLVQELL